MVLALQAENGGHGVDLAAPPLINVWSGAVDTGGAWLMRGQVDQRDRVPTWVSQQIVTLTVGRFRELPAEVTQAGLTGLVDELYADLSVVKREAKKRDVRAFTLGLRPGDLVATDDNGMLRLGRVGRHAADPGHHRRDDRAAPPRRLAPRWSEDHRAAEYRGSHG